MSVVTVVQFIYKFMRSSTKIDPIICLLIVRICISSLYRLFTVDLRTLESDSGCPMRVILTNYERIKDHLPGHTRKLLKIGDQVILLTQDDELPTCCLIP